MSEIAFLLGQNDRLAIALRGHEHGQPRIRIGRARLRVGSLRCVVDVAFDQGELDLFFHDVRSCCETLRGSFGLRTPDGSLIVEGAMAPHGHARVSVRMSRDAHLQRDDPQWEVAASFACPAERLPLL